MFPLPPLYYNIEDLNSDRITPCTGTVDKYNYTLTKQTNADFTQTIHKTKKSSFPPGML